MKKVYGMGHEVICNSVDCENYQSPTVCKVYEPRKPITLVRGACGMYKKKEG